MIKIGTCRSKKGQIASGELEVGQTDSGLTLKIPIIIAEGKKKGKTVLISTGMHGDEINGIEMVDKFIDEFKCKKMINELSGTLIIIPVLNPFGFVQKMRYVPFDKKDLNRSFNQDDDSITNQIADTIYEKVISRCDLGIDLHDSGDENILLPHTRVHFEETDKGKTLKLGQIFGTEIIMQRNAAKGMMAIEAYNKGKKPILTVEIGGALKIVHKYHHYGVRGIMNILKYYSLLPGKAEVPETQIILDKRKRYKSPITGVINFHKKLGDPVETGEHIATIYNPYTRKHHKLKAKECGVIFSVKHQAVVLQSETAFTTMEFEACPINIKKPVGCKTILNKKSKKVDLVPSNMFKEKIKLTI